MACSSPSGGSTMATPTHSRSRSRSQPPPKHPRLRLRNISNPSRRQSSIRHPNPNLSRRLRRSNRLLRLLPPRVQLHPLRPSPRAQRRAVCPLPRVTVLPLPVPPRVRPRRPIPPPRRGKTSRTSKTCAPSSSNLAGSSPRLVGVN